LYDRLLKTATRQGFLLKWSDDKFRLYDALTDWITADEMTALLSKPKAPPVRTRRLSDSTRAIISTRSATNEVRQAPRVSLPRISIQEHPEIG
jgi:hypothetical protein